MLTKEKLTVGWREWVALPDLGLPAIKAKVDTGARTSALHADDVREFTENGVQRVEFKVHPKQLTQEPVVTCVADVVDKRHVTDSGGNKEKRWVISSELLLGTQRWPIELTLTTRYDMRFRMLLGRTAISKRAVVDPARSYVAGKNPDKKSKKRKKRAATKKRSPK